MYISLRWGTSPGLQDSICRSPFLMPWPVVFPHYPSRHNQQHYKGHLCMWLFKNKYLSQPTVSAGIWVAHSRFCVVWFQKGWGKNWCFPSPVTFFSLALYLFLKAELFCSSIDLRYHQSDLTLKVIIIYFFFWYRKIRKKRGTVSVWAWIKWHI